MHRTHDRPCLQKTEIQKEGNVMSKKLYMGCVIILLFLCTACSNQKTEKSEIETTEMPSEATVIGESGKRYKFDHSDTINTEDESSGFDKYSKLQDVLKNIIIQTD